MSTLTKAACGSLVHDNYNVTGTASIKTMTGDTNFLLIYNTDATTSILVSFDAGVTFFTIPAGASLSVDVNKLLTYSIKSSSGTIAVQALYGKEI